MSVQMSPAINELATALAKAQSKIKHAKKSGHNPFFDSEYSTLGDVFDASREELTQNGLSVSQTLSIIQGEPTTLNTILLHSSGQWIVSNIFVNSKDSSPQSMKSAITLLRRASYESIVGVAGEDDDGNDSSPKNNVPDFETFKTFENTKPEPLKGTSKIEDPKSIHVGRTYDEVLKYDAGQGYVWSKMIKSKIDAGLSLHPSVARYHVFAKENGVFE